jgi:hypothetical protein
MWKIYMAKAKEAPRGNPNPVQTPEFKAMQKVAPDVPKGIKLSKKMTAVRLPEQIAATIDTLGEVKPVWLRRVITEAAQRELMKDGGS